MSELSEKSPTDLKDPEEYFKEFIGYESYELLEKYKPKPIDVRITDRPYEIIN